MTKPINYGVFCITSGSNGHSFLPTYGWQTIIAIYVFRVRTWVARVVCADWNRERVHVMIRSQTTVSRECVFFYHTKSLFRNGRCVGLGLGLPDSGRTGTRPVNWKKNVDEYLRCPIRSTDRILLRFICEPSINDPRGISFLTNVSTPSVLCSTLNS